MTATEFNDRFDYDPDLDLLGEGGFGKIYKAWDNVRNEFIALKMSKVQAGMEEFSLLSEYERVRRLEHPNIARYMDCQRIKLPGLGTHDIALMKYYEHGNLGQVMKSHTLSVAQKQKIIDGLLSGIGYLHKQNPLIIHSDLKPSNILIVQRNGFFIPLITDFGISRQAKVEDKSYVTNTVGAGTYAYAAPEQWEAKELRTNVDLWSFGILLIYVWFNGKKLPFRSDDISVATESGRIEYMKRVIALDFIPDLKELPEQYKKMVDACLVVNPKNRVRSVDELYSRINPEYAKPAEEANPVPPKPKPSNPRMVAMEEKTQVFSEKHKEDPEPVLPPISNQEVKDETKVPDQNEKRTSKPVLIAASLFLAAAMGTGGWYAYQNANLKPDSAVKTVPALPVVTDTVVAVKPLSKKEEKINPKKETKKEIAQVKKTETGDGAVYHIVENSPGFPGGAVALKSWIADHIRMPKEAERSFITGKVRLSFVVNKDGSLQDIAVVKGLGYGCDEEAIRLVNSMPSWIPGQTSGRIVKVRQTLDIPFD